MKLKLYLRMVVAVMVAMLTATGCNSSKEEPVGPVNDPLTFQLEVSDIGTGKATVAVKPNKDTPTYYCGAMEKSVYDAFASEADFLAADLKRLQNLATQNKMTLKAYLETNTYRGEGNRTVMTSAAKTAHYAYVYGIKADGMVTSTVYKVEFISGDVPAGPVVDLKMWPGDDNGANKSVMLSFSVAVTKSPAVSSKYYFDSTAEIEKALAAGQTYESLAASSTTAFNAEMITEMNSPAGLTGYAFGTVAKPLPADTSCTLIVLVTDANGVVSVEHVEAKTDPSSGGGDGPTVTVTVAPGKYPNGGDPTTQVHLIIESDPMNVTAGKYLIAETSAVQAAIDGGMTYESLVSELGTALDAEGIGIINDGGLVLNMKEGTCKPGTSYTGVVLLTNPSGTSVGHGAGSTTGGGGGDTPTDAYKAWLGTWTVKSTSSEITKTPLTFDIKVDQKVANSTYTIVGLTSSLYRDDAAKYYSLFPTGAFDVATGNWTLKNQIIEPIDDEDGTGNYIYNIRYKTPDGKTYLDKQTGYVAMTAQLKADKTSADLAGSTLVGQDEKEVGTVMSMDFFFWYETGKEAGKIYGTAAGVGFTSGEYINYPVGPYTLTKKSGASAPVKNMALLSQNAALKQKSSIVHTRGANVNLLFSSVLKISTSAPATFNGLQTKLQMTKLSSAAYNAKPKSATYEMVRVK